MVNHDDPLSTVLSALADPTRRGIIELLAQGPASVSELARPFDMTLPSVLKHLGVLEGAGLISTRKDGRVKRCQLHRESLTESARWMQRHRRLDHPSRRPRHTPGEAVKPAEQPSSLRLERHVEATPGDVFAAWTDATRLTTWYAPVPGWIVTGAVVDARVGGAYSLSFGPPPDGNLYSEKGVYLIVDPPHRLQWRGEVSGDTTEYTVIDVQFDATASGTTVTIVESGYRNSDVAAEHEAGWRLLLDNLAELFVAR